MNRTGRPGRQQAALDAHTPPGDATPADHAADQNAKEGLPSEFDFLLPDDCGGLGRLGPYRVLKVLGRGGMGIVFLAEDPALNRQVALKVMLSEAARKRSARERFLLEARATANIQHDHIVTIYQVGHDRGVPYLAMQLLKGVSLEAWLSQGNRPTLKQVLRIGRETARGLEAAHAQGLIHRDIKPANLWLEDRSQGNDTRAAVPVRVKILDFGLARPTETDNELTRQGTILGTPSYMSPEQARGKELDARSDLFSLGCVLYRLLTGELPFKAPDTLALLYALANDAHRRVRDLNPEVPPVVGEMIDRLLAKDPAQRPASARLTAETLQSIERELAGMTTTTSLPLPALKKRTMQVDRLPTRSRPAVAGRRPGNRRLVIGLAAGIGMLLVAFLSCGLLGFLGAWGIPFVGHQARNENNMPPVENAPTPALPPPPAIARAPFSEERAREFQDQWAAFLKTRVYESNSLGMKLALVPPGEFDMGASQEEFQKHLQKFGKFFPDPAARMSPGEGPVHTVRLTRPLFVGATVVTVGQFRQFIVDQKFRTEAETTGRGGTAIVEAAGGGDKFGKGFKLPMPRETEERRPEFTWEKPGFKPSDQHPVCNVTWHDANAFCSWLTAREGKTYRLPTEAEWEYACRAGTTGPWSSGESTSVKGSLAMWTLANSKKEPHPVAQWSANPFGLFDMHGNVGELCADFYDLDYYGISPSEDPLAVNDRGKGRVVRGGSFHQPPSAARSAHRAGSASTPSVQIGFRVVCELPPTTK